jgi:hypothetical protein
MVSESSDELLKSSLQKPLNTADTKKGFLMFYGLKVTQPLTSSPGLYREIPRKAKPRLNLLAEPHKNLHNQIHFAVSERCTFPYRIRKRAPCVKPRNFSAFHRAPREKKSENCRTLRPSVVVVCLSEFCCSAVLFVVLLLCLQGGLE